MTSKKSIVVLTTGGTIASAPTTEGRNRSGAIAGDDLVRTLDSLGSHDAEITVVPALQKPSNAIDLDDLLYLREKCEELSCQADVSGIVITHGTDTLEETAYFLDLTARRDNCSIVMTGSQRAPHELGSDAHRNLRDAIVAAHDPRTQTMGVLVAFNENLYTSRRVRKVHTYQLAAFDAPGSGRVGFIDQGRLCLEQRDIPVERKLVPGSRLARVEILPAYMDASPALVRAAVDSGAEALVLDALGRGHVPPSWIDPVKWAVNRAIPIVVTSSCTDGPVYQSYDFPGSLTDLERVGAIPVPGLSARKARLKLATLLSVANGSGRDLAECLQADSMAGTASVN